MSIEITVGELTITRLNKKRDFLTRQLWLTFRELSDLYRTDEFPENDLALWDVVTKHRAVQEALNIAAEKGGEG